MIDASTSVAVPPIIASLSIVPVFYGYMAKTAKQLRRPCPGVFSPEFKINLIKSIPTFGTAVGVQLAAHSIVQRVFFSSKESSLSSLGDVFKFRMT